MLFAGTIEKEWDRHGIQKLEFHRHDNSPHSAGRLTSHPAKTFSKGTLFDIFCMLYVDDSAFAFVSGQYFEIGTYLVFKQFGRLGLEMHVGNADKTLKTECVLFPAPGHFKPPPLPSFTLSTDPSALPVNLKPKQESEERKRRAKAKTTQ